MENNLGKRQKEFYEDRTRYFLPRRTNVLIRLDGNCFSKFTKQFKKPFDADFINLMNETAKYVCSEIQGAKLAYVQSDEISVYITDYDQLETDAWFDYNIQKMTSISASKATSKFNSEYIKWKLKNGFDFSKDIKLAEFDSRVWSIPYQGEVENCFIWRQQDCVRNSILSVAQCHFSYKERDNKKTNELKELLLEKGVDWNSFPIGQQRGRVIVRETIEAKEGVFRNKWIIKDAPVFVKEREEFFKNIFPKEK
jgi:tRNA(His) 5'-end guanylyltransferase